MKIPNLKSYVENASSNDARTPKIMGNYRGTELDKASFARRYAPQGTIRNTDKKK